MFERIVAALEPFALVTVVAAGLILSGRITVSDRGIVGAATIFIGVVLIIVHIVRQVKNNSISK